jgi:CheY-like chemotaxis protein
MACLILIVDDEPDLAESCGRLLSLKGHKCVLAHGQIEAMTMIDTLVPDLVLTDLYLSDGDGLAVARHARRRVPPLPIILMTAYHSPTGWRRRPKWAQRTICASRLRWPNWIARSARRSRRHICWFARRTAELI